MNTIASGLEVSPGELGGHRLIGYLIACRKRQQYVKLCEADLESRDSVGWRPGGRPGESLAERSLCKLAVRPAIRGEPYRIEEFAIKKQNPSSKRV